VDAVAQALLALGPGVIMLTRGAQGVSVYSATGMVTVPAYPVAVVDTTAAGDAFNGALALAIAEGRELGDMVRFATAAAALTCMQPGAQDALPIRPQVDRFLNTSS
jgi:ribokinase